MQKLAPSLTASLPPLEAETLTHQQILGPTLFFLFVFRIIIWTKKAPAVAGFATTQMELWVLTPQQAPGQWQRGWRCHFGHAVSTHSPCRVYTESHRCELVSRTRLGQHSLLLCLGWTASHLCHLRFLSQQCKSRDSQETVFKTRTRQLSNTKADWKIPMLP